MRGEAKNEQARELLRGVCYSESSFVSLLDQVSSTSGVLADVWEGDDFMLLSTIASYLQLSDAESIEIASHPNPQPYTEAVGRPGIEGKLCRDAAVEEIEYFIDNGKVVPCDRRLVELEKGQKKYWRGGKG